MLDEERARPRVVVADGHEIVREGIVFHLKEKCNVDIVGEAASGFETFKICRQSKPDLLLMDMSLTRPSGVDTFLKLRETAPDIKILAMSSDSVATEAFHLLTRGAVGFIPRQAKSSHFVTAVNTVLLGYSCFPGDFLGDFAQLRRQASRTGNIFGLSQRELEVLNACNRSSRSKDIAAQLNISVRTVESHRNSIYRKTNCRSIEEIALIISSGTEARDEHEIVVQK